MSTSAQRATAQTVVELELVLALDASTSVDSKEFALQRGGLAAAFRHPGVIAAINAVGGRGIAIAVVDWAGRGRQSVAVDWLHIHDADSAGRLAAGIEASPRPFSGFTDIAGAIRTSMAMIRQNRFDGIRKVIDVSGDGSSHESSPAAARDAAVAAGITINGLIIQSTDYDLAKLAELELESHYRRDVIGGPGAFLMEARDFTDFARAIRMKLVREITGSLFAGR